MHPFPQRRWILMFDVFSRNCSRLTLTSLNLSNHLDVADTHGQEELRGSRDVKTFPSWYLFPKCFKSTSSSILSPSSPATRMTVWVSLNRTNWFFSCVPRRSSTGWVVVLSSLLEHSFPGSRNVTASSVSPATPSSLEIIS